MKNENKLYSSVKTTLKTILFRSVVDWFKNVAIDGEHDRHEEGSKPTRVILLCPWERQFKPLSSAWRSW